MAKLPALGAWPAYGFILYKMLMKDMMQWQKKATT